MRQGRVDRGDQPVQTRITEPHKTILILEDSKVQAHRLAEILREESYDVVAVEDGLEGLYALQSIRPDVIVSDVWMPKMNGYEFCSAVKEDGDLSQVPLI